MLHGLHFYRLHFSCYTDWSKGDHHARFENTSLHSTHRGSTNATDCIDILEGQIQGLVTWASWWQDAIQSFKQGGSTGIAVLTGTFHPFNHGMLALGSSMLSPFQPEIGTNATVSGL